MSTNTEQWYQSRIQMVRTATAAIRRRTPRTSSALLVVGLWHIFSESSVKPSGRNLRRATMRQLFLCALPKTFKTAEDVDKAIAQALEEKYLNIVAPLPYPEREVISFLDKGSSFATQVLGLSQSSLTEQQAA